MYKSIQIIIILIQGSQFIVSFLDIEELKELKYGIEITKKPVIFSHIPQDNILHISSKYGQTYQCLMPEKDDAQKNDDANDNGNTVTVKSLLDSALDGQCLIYTLGWWTYKFCYMKDITQYHEENGVAQGDILSLGQFESEKEWNETNSQGKTKANAHHYQKYTNGSNCELIGKPRQTTVKFMCNDDMDTGIASVGESETCSYVLTVNTKALCAHPLFKTRGKEKAREITCSPALTQHQYDQYVQKEEEILRKKKEAKLQAEAEAAQSSDKNKEQKSKGLLGVFESVLKGLSSLSEKQGTKPKNAFNMFNLKDSGSDLSNFWKDIGFEEAANSKSTGKIEELTKEELHKQGPGEDASKDEIKKDTMKNYDPFTGLDQTETAELLGDNGMSKGDNMMSSEGKFMERDSAESKSVAADVNKNVKRLTSLQETINEIDKQAAELIKKDQEKRKIFVQHFKKSKQKAEKQLQDFVSMLQRLRVKKGEQSSTVISKRLQKLIDRVDGSVQAYRSKLEDLDDKMKKTLQKSKNFEKKYNEIMNRYGSEKLKGRTKPRGKDVTKSINAIMKNLLKEKDNTETNRIVKTGQDLESSNDEALNEEQEEGLEEPRSGVEKKTDPLLNALLKMLQLGSKKQAEKKKLAASMEEDQSESTGDEQVYSKASNQADQFDQKEQVDQTHQTDQTDQSDRTSQNDNTDSASATDSSPGSNSESLDKKVKIRISRLGSDDARVLEEHEKQEELAGTGNDNNRLKRAGKKIEDMVKEKLKKAGVDIGANIKIKIVTNEDTISKLASDSKTDFLTDETATQFKDMLVNMLGGSTERNREEKRQMDLEDSYKFVWDSDETEKTTTEQNDDDDKLSL